MVENKKWVYRIIQAAIVLCIAAFTFQIILHVNKVQVATNLLSDCNEAAALTERLVKLSLANQETTNIDNDLNKLWEQLLDGNNSTGIEQMTYEGYWAYLQTCYNDYKNLKNSLAHYQANVITVEKMVENSEVFYQSSYRLNDLMETYSLTLIEKLKIYELLLIIFIIALIGIYFKQLLIRMKLDHYNGELQIMSYFDEPTMLPNRRRCREILSSELNFDKYQSYACVMFDLNNLKWVNDKYGHKFGDVLIAGFSNILRKYMNDQVFIGRYGGDEFIAIITDYNEQQIKEIIKNIQDSVEKFNDEHHQVPIQFAYGYDIAFKGKKIKMEEIVERADINMYKCKKKMKDCAL